MTKPDYSDPFRGDWVIPGGMLLELVNRLPSTGLTVQAATFEGVARRLLEELGAVPAGECPECGSSDRAEHGPVSPRHVEGETADCANPWHDDAPGETSSPAVRLPGWDVILGALRGIQEENCGGYPANTEEFAKGIATRLEAAQLRSGALVDTGEPGSIRINREAALDAITRVLRGLASGTVLTGPAAAEGVLAALEEAGAVQVPDSGQITSEEIGRAVKALNIDVAKYGGTHGEPVHRGRVVNPDKAGRLIHEQVMFLRHNDNQQHPKRPHPGHDAPEAHVCCEHAESYPDAIDAVTLNDVLCDIYPDMTPAQTETLARNIAGQYEAAHRKVREAMAKNDAAILNESIRAGVPLQVDDGPVCTCEDDDPDDGCEVHGVKTTSFTDEADAFCQVAAILAPLNNGAQERIIDHYAGMLGGKPQFD